MYFELLRRFDNNLPTLHAIDDMDIESERLNELIKAQKALAE
jgi:hypothetical protein